MQIKLSTFNLIKLILNELRLGRCKSIQDIKIVGTFDEKQIFCSEDALKASIELQERAFKCQDDENQFFKDASFIVGFINISSLRAHHAHFMQDNDFMNCKVIGLAETWLYPGEEIDTIPYEGHFINTGRGKGLATLTKDHVQQIEIIKKVEYSMMKIKVENMSIIFVYISKTASPSEYLKDVDGLLQGGIHKPCGQR